ncbi:MAG: hypothetical protein KF767_03715 [Bdellovibrionaceae bacterium]|nr:hypothetical protein [Pseudobdellovibrionaceae bacterium]
MTGSTEMDRVLIALKVGIALVGILLWLQSQKWIGRHMMNTSREIRDRVHEWTAPLFHMLAAHAAAANALLISSSLVIDILGFYLLGSAIFGETLRPLIGLFILFGLRQLNQALTSLPVPEGMIWRHPGFPSVFVTYGVSNDLFFSGHTALAVYGALELATATGGGPWLLLGVAIIAFEVMTVLLLRAHWTMDVFAGAVTALWVHTVALAVAPAVDEILRVWAQGLPVP